MKEIKSKNVQNYVMNDMVFKVDIPRLLKEIAECSKSTPYPVIRFWHVCLEYLQKGLLK